MPKDTAALFASHHRLPAIREAALEAGLGEITRDGDAARITLGCYEMFGGDPASEGARRLVAGAQRVELVYDNDAAWRRTILEVQRDRVRDRPMIEFETGALDPQALARMASAIASDFELRRIDEALAAQLDGGLEPHALQVYPSARDFVERGLGFGAVHEGVLACAATSYTMSSRHLEVAISTRVEFRGRGLAMAVSAALMAESLARGITPNWSASNPVSKRLAERLGYRPGEECEILLMRV